MIERLPKDDINGAVRLIEIDDDDDDDVSIIMFAATAADARRVVINTILDIIQGCVVVVLATNIIYYCDINQRGVWVYEDRVCQAKDSFENFPQTDDPIFLISAFAAVCSI